MDENPLDFGDILPEDFGVSDNLDLSRYLPEELPPERAARRQRGPVSTAVAEDLPPEARALLDTIAMDESPDYNTIFGGQKFEDYSRHPGVYVPIRKGPNAGSKSSAAGRYQFLQSTWDDQATKLGLTDFSPENQDRAAWNYAQEVYGNKTGRDLLADLKTGDPRFQQGIASALSSVWTSMPGGIEQRSSADKFLKRYTDSLTAQGAAPQGPQGETYDIPLSNGQIFTVPKDVSREEAIAGLRASGMDVEGVTEHALTGNRFLTLPDSADINHALLELQKQFPDQEWMTQEHAAKTGFMPAAEAAFKGLLPQAKRGVGELLEEFGPTREAGRNWIEESKKEQEALAKISEPPLETDPLSKKLAYYGGTAAGGFLPFVAGAALAPELALPLAVGTSPILAAGSLGQRYDEQGRPLELTEPKNIAAIGAETALQAAGLRGLAPVAGQFGRSAIKGAAGALAADVPSVAIERAAAGQDLLTKQALEEYGGTALADVLGGGTLGAAGAIRGRRAAPEAPVQEGPAPSPIEPAPTGGEALAPTEGPAETVEDLEAQARAGEEFFRQAEAAKAAEPAPEITPPESEIPEPVVRGEEQAMPTVEAPAPEPHFAESVLGLKPVKDKRSLYQKLQGLDIGNIEDHPKIEEIIGKSSILSGDKLDALSARMKEVEDASTQQIPEPSDAGGGARPQGGEEVGYPPVSGEGVRVSDQEGKGLAGEGKGQEEVTPVKIPQAAPIKAPEAVASAELSPEEAGARHAAFLRQYARKTTDTRELHKVLNNINPHTMADAQNIAWDVSQNPNADAETKARALDFYDRIPAMKEAAPPAPEVKVETPETRKFAKAEEPTHIDVDGVQRPVTDSTGQRIHTTDEGVKNFWKEFEGTKVVDEEGRPLRVYHGTRAGNFTVFDPSKGASHGKKDFLAKIGSNFAKDYSVAARFATGDAQFGRTVSPIGHVKEAYIKMVNPLVVSNEKDAKRLFNPAVHDGIIYKNEAGLETKHAADATAYVVPNSTQIKSAIGNVGAFDTTKADIREARGVAPEAAHTPESLGQHIKTTYGAEAPRVDVLTREQAGVEPNVKGFYDPNTQRVALIADNIGKGEDIHGLMRHEVAVHAKRLGKSDPEFQAILDRLQKLKDSGDASVARAYDRVPKDTNPAHVHEEALAYLSQHAPNLPIVKSFTSWMRRMAHKLTGSADWLKADDFGPMADAILKRGEPAAPKAKGRMYSVGDAANDAVQNAATENWFERFYTPIRTKVVSVRAPLEAILGKLPLYDENNEIRATAKIAQQTRYAHLVSEALHTGFLARNKQGLIEAVFDPRLSPDQIINRVMELPEAVRDRFSESMVTLAQAGHNLRGAEMKAVMDEAQRKIKLGQAYLDKTKSDYEKTKSALDTIKDLSYRMKDNPRVQRELEKAQREFDAAKAEYRNPNYTAGKDYIAAQQRLYRAVKDQFTKAKRNEAGHIYDISPEQERAARQFLESNPEAKQLAADIRELFTNNAKLLRDTGVISNETYKKFTDSKYNYAPLYMSIEDLDAAMPASAVYLQGGQRKVMPVKGLKGSPHQVQFFENLLTHQARTGAMALHNNARLGAMESLVEMGRAKELPGTTPPAKGVDVVAAIKDGKRRYYHVPDRPLYEAFEMVHNLPVPDWITDTTKFASRAMLVNPKYWWNQLVREPFMATFTTRAGIITPFHSGKEFASLLFSELPGVDTNAAQLYRELKAQGVSGSHEYLRDLIKEKGKLQASKGLAKNYKDSRDLVMRIHEYADAATKVAVMRKALERAESGKLTGKPLQGEAARDAAITHVGEMINFANRGRSSTVQYITQATPFFNSWAQGMDAIIRSATGYGMDPHAKGSTIAGLRTTFIGHAAALMAFSAAITALRCEFSEDYREADPEEWSANWLIPLPESFETKKGRMVKAKGPFELNTLFKLGPEMWVRNWYGLDRGKDYTATLKSSIWRDIAPPGLDQLFMPYLPMLMLESATGYKVSEGEIKPLADMSLAPAERGKGVSPIADFLSGGPVSPAAVKNFGQGFFGGMYDMLDSTAKGAAAAFGSNTARADLRDLTEKVPVISGMLTNPDRIELGSAYEFADKQAMARHTAKVLTRRGEKEEAKEYAEEGRYAKQAEKIKRKLAKTNTAIERLKNTKEYTDAEAIQREYEAQLEKKRKQVGRLEALRAKSEKD